MKKLLALLLLAATPLFANPFLVCPSVTAGVSNSPVTYTVSGLPNSPIVINAVTITSGTVQLDLDLGSAGQNVPVGSYTVSATATNPNGTSASSANFGLTVATPSVQFASYAAGTSTGVGSVAKAFTSSQASGNTNIVFVQWYKPTSPPTISSISDTKGNTYTLIYSDLNFSGDNTAAYYCSGIASGSNTVTVNFSAATAEYTCLSMAEYSGLGALDAHANAHGSSSSVNSGNLTTTVPGDILIGYATVTSNVYSSVGTGFTNEINLSPTAYVFLQDKIAGSAGSYNSTINVSGTSPWMAGAVAFKH